MALCYNKIMAVKNPFSKSNALILAPLILVMVLDFAFTLIGQPESYWQDHLFFNEGSPLGNLLLPVSPIYFALFFIFYLLFVLFLAVNLKKPLNIMIFTGFFLGHSLGSASWVSLLFYRFFQISINSWYLIIGYIVLISIISGFCISRWLKNKI